jgi:hypothetical protein
MYTENETDLDKFSNGINIQSTFRRFLCFSYFTSVVRDKSEVNAPLNLHNKMARMPVSLETGQSPAEAVNFITDPITLSS